MLSRVADSLYWMSRYLERAEHTARLLDVNINLMLDYSPAGAEARWKRLLSSLRAPAVEEACDPYRVTNLLTFDAANSNSIVECIISARENARQAREQISSEMWEHLNSLYLNARAASMETVWNGQPHEFFRSIKDGSHLFQGITDSTMSHNESWQFIQIGRGLERAGAVATLLDAHFLSMPNEQNGLAGAESYLDGVALLKSCTAFESYCKVYTADLRPERIAEFLLLDKDFPRSVHFCADRVHEALQCIGQETESRQAESVTRLSGRLRAHLSFGHMDEIMAEGLHSFLKYTQHQCGQIHSAIYRLYIAYSIQEALAA